MSQVRMQEEVIDTSFGFPVHLLNVPMIQVRGIWTPKLNYARLALMVLKELAQKPAPLTGHQLRFIRHSFEMTLKDFADRFDVTHPAVLKWEQKGDLATRMNWSTEKDIRLAVYEHVSAREFRDLYRQLEKKPGPSLGMEELTITLDNLFSVSA